MSVAKEILKALKTTNGCATPNIAAIGVTLMTGVLIAVVETIIKVKENDPKNRKNEEAGRRPS